MLHIVNGESTAIGLRQTTLQGEMFSFCDALISGPTPTGVEGSEWVRLRAEHLSEDYQEPLENCERRLVEQEQILQTLSSHDEVTLWFEHDLFCQVNLLYLLDWVTRNELGHTRLSLINIGAFPGKPNFRGLGELSAEELVSLFPNRQVLTKQELELGTLAWRAYRSADPTQIESLVRSDTARIPFLETAFRIHLRRFPSLQNGLDRIETLALELIKQGYNRFGDLFSKFWTTEPAYGLGDAQFWNILKGLERANNPVVVVNGKVKDGTDSDTYSSLEFDLTDAGRAVLDSEVDFVSLNGLDRWLGGVHLFGREKIWRWDAKAEKLALT